MDHNYYDPYGPECAFIAKLLRKSPYEDHKIINDGASRTGKSRPEKEKRGGRIIKCLLTELGRAGRENI